MQRHRARPEKSAVGPAGVRRGGPNGRERLVCGRVMVMGKRRGK